MATLKNSFENTFKPGLLHVQCILAVVLFTWVFSPLVQFLQSMNAEVARSEWIFDFAEDERSGEKETEQDKTDDEEKTHNVARQKNERVARDVMSCIVWLKERLEDGPNLDRPGQPPRA